MKCDVITNYNKKIFFDRNYFRKISYTDDNVMNLLNNMGNNYNSIVLENINSINNQNIQSINFDTYKYRHRDIELGFSKLSKAEGIFLIATVADIKKEEIWLHTDITQLTRKTLIKFIRTFKESPYINIIYDSKLSKAYYDSAIREASK